MLHPKSGKSILYSISFYFQLTNTPINLQIRATHKTHVQKMKPQCVIFPAVSQGKLHQTSGLFRAGLPTAAPQCFQKELLGDAVNHLSCWDVLYSRTELPPRNISPTVQALPCYPESWRFWNEMRQGRSQEKSDNGTYRCIPFQRREAKMDYKSRFMRPFPASLPESGPRSFPKQRDKGFSLRSMRAYLFSL